ncbi:MAG TPA: GTPase ObgE [Candidatus Parcubacteria bacterium]|jgi:GTP-binding protein|nr:GTPase ObgE [Parcubacteria group bacterium]HJN62067.1 GTPase ObgE [Candidatus Parcubacteria bacterium]|tara:strand:+ start:38 stop:1006 length:969 start_codon:yes stop_codon:yes gene_type:complete
MLIDDIKIKVKGGDGGKGAVAFSKVKMSLGPTGGAGGKGGSVYFEGVSDLSALNQFRFKKELSAGNGKNGKGKFIDGTDGKDLFLKVPVGTVIHNLSLKEDSEIISIGQRLLIVKGGKGGWGNFKFRSSTNTSPKEFGQGSLGQEYELRLELKMIADVGFVGLPNVGKSSLLNELTKAKSKVANYPFTTLSPNLGVYFELVLADIPGLIEGASLGKGLGIKFLRHIKRTKTLFHFISSESQDPLKDYKIIRKELEAYNKELLLKPEYVFLTKSDLLSEKDIKKKVALLKKTKREVLAVSIINEKSLKLIEGILREIIKQKSE